MNFNINRVKIFVTVPINTVEDIRKAVCEAGVRIIGEYSYCILSTRVTGTFIPNENANSYIGELNKLEIEAHKID